LKKKKALWIEVSTAENIGSGIKNGKQKKELSYPRKEKN
jgi:hypothetical protein